MLESTLQICDRVLPRGIKSAASFTYKSTGHLSHSLSSGKSYLECPHLEQRFDHHPRILGGLRWAVSKSFRSLLWNLLLGFRCWFSPSKMFVPRLVELILYRRCDGWMTTRIVSCVLRLCLPIIASISQERLRMNKIARKYPSNRK